MDSLPEQSGNKIPIRVVHHNDVLEKTNFRLNDLAVETILNDLSRPDTNLSNVEVEGTLFPPEYYGTGTTNQKTYHKLPVLPPAYMETTESLVATCNQAAVEQLWKIIDKQTPTNPLDEAMRPLERRIHRKLGRAVLTATLFTLGNTIAVAKGIDSTGVDPAITMTSGLISGGVIAKLLIKNLRNKSVKFSKNFVKKKEEVENELLSKRGARVREIADQIRVVIPKESFVPESP